MAQGADKNDSQVILFVIEKVAAAPMSHSSEDNEGSKRGQVFVSASQHEMPNVGEKPVCGVSEEWDEVGTVYQLIDGVDRPLDSVSSICDGGNWVAFGRNGGFIQNLETGKTTFFPREDDVYVRSMWIKDEAGTGFTRPGQ